jgi:ubiquitin carboxyl-terminal hydrolase 34
VFWQCLFEIPTPASVGVAAPPRCKSRAARGAAFDLLVEMSSGCLPNLVALLQSLIPQHQHGTQWREMEQEKGEDDTQACR